MVPGASPPLRDIHKPIEIEAELSADLQGQDEEAG